MPAVQRLAGFIGLFAFCQVFHQDFFGVADPEIKQGGIVVEFEIGFHDGSVGGLTLAFEILKL